MRTREQEPLSIEVRFLLSHIVKRTRHGEKPMKHARRIRRALTLAGALVVGACASGGSTPGAEPAGAQTGGGDQVAVQVRNDIVPPATITVYIAPETGSRRRLGTIPPNGQQTFTYNPGIRSMEHRLVAEVSGGQGTQSNPFTLEGATRVTWGASTQVVNVIRGDQ